MNTIDLNIKYMVSEFSGLLFIHWSNFSFKGEQSSDFETPLVGNCTEIKFVTISEVMCL